KQPMPLEPKVTQELKNTHTEQMTRLHFKHQTECDLLEDMRYDGSPSLLLCLCFQALQKLASQYLKRDWPGISPDDQRTDYRNVYAVWRAYLEGTVQVSQSRLNVCDNYKSQISEPAKTVRLYKEHVAFLPPLGSSSYGDIFTSLSSQLWLALASIG
uniref:Uncharacterized protein n=1 Tax=Xiphophorus couchianus TaxID=32473 RepID=A0A3B5LYK6_9TELE